MIGESIVTGSLTDSLPTRSYILVVLLVILESWYGMLHWVLLVSWFPVCALLRFGCYR